MNFYIIHKSNIGYTEVKFMYSSKFHMEYVMHQSLKSVYKAMNFLAAHFGSTHKCKYCVRCIATTYK